MKLALALIIALSGTLASSGAHAGSMYTSCSNRSGSIKIDGYEVTLKKPGKKAIKLDLISGADGLNVGDKLQFGKFQPKEVVLMELKVIKAGEMKLVSEDGGEACSDGEGGMTAHEGGSTDESQIVKVSFREGGKSKIETLTCNTHSGYSGRCVYPEDVEGK